MLVRETSYSRSDNSPSSAWPVGSSCTTESESELVSISVSGVCCASTVEVLGAGVVGRIRSVIRLRPVSRLLLKSGLSVGQLLVSGGRSVEAQRRAQCCQQHRLVEV